MFIVEYTGQMEELTRLQASRKGFKSHVTRLYNKVDELIDNEVDEYSVALLTKTMEQLRSKGDKLNKIDEQIVTLINDPEELEYYIVESEELQDAITDKMTKIRTFIDLQRTKPQESSSEFTNQLPVSQHEVNTSPPQLVTATTVSNSLPQVSISSPQLDSATTLAMASQATELPLLVTSTALVSSDTTLQSSVPIPFVPTPQLILADNIEMPPLIPAAPHMIVSSHTIQQRPANVSVPDARSLHNTSIVNRFALQEPALATSASVGRYHATQQFATSRLPKLTLPTFSGDPLTWQTFWDSFYAAIHANTTLSGIQKFNYLKAQLQGDAARAIDGLPLSELNYTHSIAFLQSRFGQPHKLVNAHMKALLDMPSPTNNLASLRMFYDSVESHIRGLSSLGKSE